MPPERAEEIAIKALGWLAACDDLLDVFLGTSGMGADDLRAAVTRPDGPDAMVLGAVLDFVMSQDRWVIGFCDAADLDYALVGAARHSLPGGSDPHWT